MTTYVKSEDGVFWRQDVFTHFRVTDKGVLAKFTDPAGDYIEVSFAAHEWANPRDRAAIAPRRGQP